MASRLKSADGFYGWVNLLVMFFFNIVFMMMMLSFALFLPSWVQEFSWSRGTMSLAQALAMILMGLAAPLVGIFIMKKGVKYVIPQFFTYTVDWRDNGKKNLEQRCVLHR